MYESILNPIGSFLIGLRGRTLTFGEWDDDQGSVHEDRVRQVLRNANWFRFEELYKTDTGSHRQGRITGRKYKGFCKTYM